MYIRRSARFMERTLTGSKCRQRGEKTNSGGEAAVDFVIAPCIRSTWKELVWCFDTGVQH